MITKTKTMIILLDFDGTVVTHNFPQIGTDIGAVPVLKELINAGHKLILFTMRSDTCDPNHKYNPKQDGMYLTDAVNWFKENDIPLYGIQTNPEQHSWTSSPKAYGHLIIDDTALGCPLIHPENKRSYVDWEVVRAWLIANKYI